jgi:ADP-ribose pyrophosphatase YjhB (NUDIX family)
MRAIFVLGQIDRIGTAALLYLLPWQARFIFTQGTLAGAPSEPRTVSLYAIEVAIWAMLAIRMAAILIEKDRVRRSRCYSLKSVGSILIALSALLIAAAFSAVVSVDKLSTLLLAQHLFDGLAVLFIVMTAPSAKEARAAFVIGAIVQSLIAFVQVVFQRIYPSPWFGVAAHFPEVPGTSVVEADGIRFLRAYGTLPHPNILGGMLAIAIISARPLFRRVSAVGWSAYLILGAGLFFTFSRAAWVAAFAGMAAQWIYARKDRIFIRQAPAVILAMAVCAAFFWPFVFNRATGAGMLEGKSISARVASFNDAASLIRRNPVVGVGAGAFTSAVLEQVDAKRDGYALEPVHSAPVDILAELGIFGLLIYAWLIYVAVRLTWKSGRIGLGVTLVALALFDHWTWTTFGGVVIFWAGWGFFFRGCREDGVTHKAGAVVISKDDPGRVLLLYRDGPNYCDWTLPKGHMEPGESREETTKREIKEETGLDIEILGTLPDRNYNTFSGKAAVAHLFLARSLDDGKLRPEPGYPRNRVEWVHLSEAEDRLTFDNMKAYFRDIKALIESAAERKKRA